MFGRECPCACTRQGREVDGEWQEGVSEEDIIRATTVKGLRRDNMGLGMVLYTG